VITGHLGVAAAIRSGWRDASLLWLLPASIAPDLLDAAYAAVGFCNPYGLYSHTVPVAALLGAVLGTIAYLGTGSRTTAMATGLVVLAHLPPDLITGHKVYWPGGPLLGLELYRHRALDFLVELPVALGGWWLLRRSGGAPRWAVVGAAAGALVAVQATFDIAKIMKPTACALPSDGAAAVRP
jgi:hypothetical protein